MTTTTDLLKLDRQGFINALSSLHHDQCENHVRELLELLDGPSFTEYVKSLVDAAMTDVENIDGYYLATRKYFPDVPKENDILGRLCGLSLKMMADRLTENKEKIRTI